MCAFFLFFNIFNIFIAKRNIWKCKDCFFMNNIWYLGIFWRFFCAFYAWFLCALVFSGVLCSFHGQEEAWKPSTSLYCVNLLIVVCRAYNAWNCIDLQNASIQNDCDLVHGWWRVSRLCPRCFVISDVIRGTCHDGASAPDDFNYDETSRAILNAGILKTCAITSAACSADYCECIYTIKSVFNVDLHYGSCIFCPMLWCELWVLPMLCVSCGSWQIGESGVKCHSCWIGEKYLRSFNHWWCRKWEDMKKSLLWPLCIGVIKVW